MRSTTSRFVDSIARVLPRNCGGRALKKSTSIDKSTQTEEYSNESNHSEKDSKESKQNDDATSKDPSKDSEAVENITKSWEGCPRAIEADFRPKDTYLHLKDFDEGEEGQCSVVRSQSTGLLFVAKHTRAASRAKSSNLEQTGKRKPLPNESKILQTLHPHPNIIRFYGLEPSPLNPDGHILFLEFCNAGDLLEQLRTFQKSKRLPPVVFTLHVLVSLTHALAYLHRGLRWKNGTAYVRHKDLEPVIHGDIKPDNIFLRWPGRIEEGLGMPDVVLADFGMAQLASESRGITGTPGYDSPEVRRIANLRETNPTAFEVGKATANIMTPKSDIYQFGLLIHLMATGKHFPCGADPSTIDMEPAHRGVTGLLALAVWCLQVDPVDRPECSGSVERGMLFAVEMLRKKRDARVALGGELDGVVWNGSEFKDEPVFG